jgi:hypothetical protein
MSSYKTPRRKVVRKKEKYQPRALQKPKKKDTFYKPSEIAMHILGNIIRTYNVSELKLLEDEEDDRDFNYVKSELLKRSDIFENLIGNLEYKSLDPISFVTGPQFFAKMTHPTKTIYLIGERHDTIKTCEDYFYNTKENFYDFKYDKLYSYPYDSAKKMDKQGLGIMVQMYDMNYAVQNIMNYGTAYVDLFVELDPFPYFSTGIVSNRNDRLAELTKLGKTLKCGRTHLVDIRGSTELINLSEEERQKYDKELDFMIALEVLSNDYFKTKDRKKYVKVFIDFYNYLFDTRLNDKEWKERVVEFIMTNRYLQKELKKSYIGDIIYSHYVEVIEKEDFFKKRADFEDYADVMKELNDLLDTPDDEEYSYSFDVKEKLVSLDAMYTHVSSPILDMYTLARIFKKSPFLDFDRPKEPTNVIVYTGARHSENMADFLTKLKFNRINGRQITENCLYTGSKEVFFH